MIRMRDFGGWSEENAIPFEFARADGSLEPDSPGITVLEHLKDMIVVVVSDSSAAC